MQTTVPVTVQEEIPTHLHLNLTQWLKESRDVQLDYLQYLDWVVNQEMGRYARFLERHPLDVTEEGVDAGWITK